MSVDTGSCRSGRQVVPAPPCLDQEPPDSPAHVHFISLPSSSSAYPDRRGTSAYVLSRRSRRDPHAGCRTSRCPPTPTTNYFPAQSPKQGWPEAQTSPFGFAQTDLLMSHPPECLALRDRHCHFHRRPRHCRSTPCLPTARPSTPLDPMARLARRPRTLSLGPRLSSLPSKHPSVQSSATDWRRDASALVPAGKQFPKERFRDDPAGRAARQPVHLPWCVAAAGRAGPARRGPLLAGSRARERTALPRRCSWSADLFADHAGTTA